MRIRPIFAWYDLWVGAFVDRPKRRLYLFPLPCVGLLIEWKARNCVDEAAMTRPKDTSELVARIETTRQQRLEMAEIAGYSVEGDGVDFALELAAGALTTAQGALSKIDAALNPSREQS